MLKRLFVVALLSATLGCHAFTPPPNLDHQATAAWHATQVIHGLDALRDGVINASQTTPPLISEHDMVEFVKWHDTAIDVAHAAPAGWQTTLKTSLALAVANLPEGPRVLVQPYVDLALRFIEGGA